MYITGFLIIITIIQSNCIGKDYSRKLPRLWTL